MTEEIKKSDKEYIPYGEEWKNEMMKLSKTELIEILKRKLLRKEKINDRRD